MPWSRVKAEQSSDTQYPLVGQCGRISEYHASRRNKRNLVISWAGAGVSCEVEKKAFSSEMFMRGLGRGIHHCRENTFYPAQESDWHLQSRTVLLRFSCVEFVVHCTSQRSFGQKTTAVCFVSSCLAKWFQYRIACDTVWWANHFLKWGEHTVLCISTVVFNEEDYFWLTTYFVVFMGAHFELSPPQTLYSCIFLHN